MDQRRNHEGNWKTSLRRHLLFSHSVVSDHLQPHGLQHAKLPCPSSSPGVSQTHVH